MPPQTTSCSCGFSSTSCGSAGGQNGWNLLNGFGQYGERGQSTAGAPAFGPGGTTVGWPKAIAPPGAAGSVAAGGCANARLLPTTRVVSEPKNPFRMTNSWREFAFRDCSLFGE